MQSTLRFLLSTCLIGLIACSGDSELGPPATLVLSTPPDFTATVTKVELESANGPAGPYSQHNMWLVIPPGTSPNAGLVVAQATPVFVRTSDGIFSSDAGRVRVGDRVEVWHDIQVANGAAEGPPGAPTYINLKQLVIDR